MTADEVYLWLLPVMAFGAFLLGGYLLVSGRQAKAAGEESHKVKFLGVEIESSTSGTTLIMLAIVVVVVVISLGIGRAVDDGNDDAASDDESSETETTDDETDDGETDDGETDDGDDNPSGLDRDRHLLSVADLAGLTQNYSFTGWRDLEPEDRPVLDCLQRSMPEMPGFVRKPVKDNFEGSAEFGYPADAMTSAARFTSAAAAEEVFTTVTGWLSSCPGGLDNSESLDVNQAGTLQSTASFRWRNFWKSPPSPSPCASSCVWMDSQGVALVDDIIVLVSVRWYQESDPTGVEGPMADLLPAAVDQADD